VTQVTLCGVMEGTLRLLKYTYFGGSGVTQTTKVWSMFIRVFHWSLVLFFVAAYITSSSGDDDIHMILGYIVSVLLFVRIVYGFTTQGYGRFSNFLYAPPMIWQHAKEIACNQPKHYLGHSPMGSAMVFALLILLLVLATSGLLYQGWGEYEGPLWWLDMMPSDVLGHDAWAVHRVLPDILWGFIALHIAGVALASIQHKENLPRAMVTGFKHNKKGDDI